MDVNPPQHDPAAGDDELAKVLAGVSDDPNEQPKQPTNGSGLQFEETPANTPAAPAPTASEPTAQPVSVPQPPAPTPPQPPATPGGTSSPAPELEKLKRSALEELRPLVDKLNLPPEERFDTLLLIIRSTDDQSLLTAAHEAAKGIADESKRAQGLLDVIKEIDYFSNPSPQQ